MADCLGLLPCDPLVAAPLEPSRLQRSLCRTASVFAALLPSGDPSHMALLGRFFRRLLGSCAAQPAEHDATRVMETYEVFIPDDCVVSLAVKPRASAGAGVTKLRPLAPTAHDSTSSAAGLEASGKAHPFGHASEHTAAADVNIGTAGATGVVTAVFGPAARTTLAKWRQEPRPTAAQLFCAMKAKAGGCKDSGDSSESAPLLPERQLTSAAGLSCGRANKSVSPFACVAQIAFAQASSPSSSLSSAEPSERAPLMARQFLSVSLSCGRVESMAWSFSCVAQVSLAPALPQAAVC